MSEPERIPASTEAHEETLATLARLAHHFYTELIVAGFSDEDAFELVQQWFGETLLDWSRRSRLH